MTHGRDRKRENDTDSTDGVPESDFNSQPTEKYCMIAPGSGHGLTETPPSGSGTGG